jgi:hypothetical protein
MAASKVNSIDQGYSKGHPYQLFDLKGHRRDLSKK